jgi:hypothetical protein
LEYQANEFVRQHPNYQLPPWGIAMFAVTSIAFVLLAMSLEYTIRLIMVNLAIIESPSATVVKVYEPLKSEGKENETVHVEIEETLVVPEKPITKSIRRTMQRLRSVGGFTARWRGLGLFFLYIVMMGVVHFIFSIFSRPHPVRAFTLTNFAADMTGALAASRIHCAWTHATISTSTKRFRDRVVSRSQWKQLLLPTALKVVLQEATLFAIALSAHASYELSRSYTGPVARALPFLVPLLVAPTLWVFVLIPTTVVLIRKEASLLSADDETIVPFDRTFGNRVVPGLTVLSLRDAWKSFGSDAWRRVVMLHVKFIAILLMVGVVYAHVLLAEAWAIMGNALPTLLCSAKARLQTMVM